jgi:uncharacterized membrane protein
MKNDLIVLTFENEADALKTRGALEIRRYSQLLGVLNTVMVIRDKTGKVVLHIQKQLPNHPEDPSSQMPELLAEAIFGNPPEKGSQMLLDAGMDDGFLKLVSPALSPGSSLILSYVPQDSLVDTQQLVEVLNQFNGTLHHTTVPEQVEKALLKQAMQE